MNSPRSTSVIRDIFNFVHSAVLNSNDRNQYERKIFIKGFNLRAEPFLCTDLIKAAILISKVLVVLHIVNNLGKDADEFIF